ncbi:MAG: hypothetical protein IGQ45_00070 [Cyanobacterium sp. T60_A2020_053]|nr:hypothetical protein [Cyanobacterium sp. T60_A2020_053]
MTVLFRGLFLKIFLSAGVLWLTNQEVKAQTPLPQDFNVSPEVIENSPVWQKWLENSPDILQEIKHQPSFPTRLRVGYSQFPSNNGIGGFSVAVEDVFIADTPLSFSARHSSSFNSDNNFERSATGADLHYYLFPLGNYVNISPIVGYQSIRTNGYQTDGVNLGVRLALVLSPNGAGDVFINQSFVNVGGDDEVGITAVGAGYAIRKNLRLSGNIEWQNSRQQADSQVSIGVEWFFNR